jgi:deazaflavin-dependent oxidoreductase (nitroreductase family)
MPLPRALARLNRIALNRLTRPFAARLPGFAVLHHTGRLSGETYATPLNAFRHEGELVVALTYGKDVDWLANARRRAPSRMVVRGEIIEVDAPRDLTTAEGMQAMPRAVRPLLRALHVDGFVAFPVIG